jgi:Protein of unknown function (DUF4054)
VAVTTTTFRESFPEFTDTLVFPEPQVAFWITLAGKMVGVDRWGDLADYGVMLLVAHNLVTSAADVQASAMGGLPGNASNGAISSQSAGGLSFSRDVSSASEQGAGNYNTTTYGTRYIRLARLVGAGPVQVGTGVISSGGGAWAGPYTYPF